MEGIQVMEGSQITEGLEENKTMLWWRILSGFATFNIILWVILLFTVDSSKPYIWWQLIFSGIFTFVCGFRSYFPRICLERYCLFDSFFSSIVLGRSLATIAEVSFAFQVALLVHEMGAATGILWVQNLFFPIILLLTIAQVFCWASVFTLNHLGHAIEESIWAFTFALVGVSMAFCLHRLDGLWYNVVLSGTVACSLYVLFMVIVDIPMYVKRLKKGKLNGDHSMDLWNGLKDALTRRVATRDWKIWKPEVAWLSGYFTFGVWVSLLMVYLERT